MAAYRPDVVYCHGRNTARRVHSYVREGFGVRVALLEQAKCDGLNRLHGLSARGVDEGLWKQEAEVARVSQLEGECVRDPVPVGPVYGTARANVFVTERNRKQNPAPYVSHCHPGYF